MKFTKIFSTLLAGVLLAGSLTACGDTGSTDTTPSGNNPGEGGNSYTLTVWCSREDQEMVKKMCNEYAAANSQNTYKFLFGVQGENDVADKVLNDVENGPDVYSFASDQINKLYAGGALARVGGEIEANIKQVNSEGSVDASTLKINGEDWLMAYPSTGDNCYFVYYDKSVFTDESQLASLDSMLDTAEAAGKNMHFRLNEDGWYLSSFFFTNPELKYDVTYNANMVEESVSVNYNSPAGLEVMKALRHYIIDRDNLVVNTDDSKIIAALTPDASGKREAAAVVTGTWNAATIKQLLGDNMGVYKLPTVNIAGKEEQLSGYMGYKLFGVNGFSKNKGEAHKLAQWLTNEQNQLTRYEVRGFGPTNKVVANNQKVQDDVVMKAVFAQAVFNRAQKGVPSTYWSPMASLITPLVKAKADKTTLTDQQLQEQLDATVKQINK